MVSPSFYTAPLGVPDGTDQGGGVQVCVSLCRLRSDYWDLSIYRMKYVVKSMFLASLLLRYGYIYTEA